MLFWAIVLSLIFYAIIFALIFLAIRLTVMLLTKLVVASRISIAALLAAMYKSQLMIVSNETVNFFLLLAIFLGVIFLLSQFPRINYAIKFLCTTFISTLVLLFVASFFSAIAPNIFKLAVWSVLLLKLGVVGITVWAMFKEFTEGTIVPHAFSSNPIVVIITRTVASVIYGFAIVILATPINGILMVTTPVLYIIWAVSAAIFFLLDIFLMGKQ